MIDIKWNINADEFTSSPDKIATQNTVTDSIISDENAIMNDVIEYDDNINLECEPFSGQTLFYIVNIAIND